MQLRGDDVDVDVPDWVNDPLGVGDGDGTGGVPPGRPPPAPLFGRLRPRWLVVAVVAALLFVSGAWGIDRVRGGPGEAIEGFPRDVSAYEGLGTWIDVFDFRPVNQPAGVTPPVTPGSVDVMAVNGVRTIYLQASVNDEQTPERIVDPDIIGAFLESAHAHGIRVVGWYLPTFTDVDEDLARMAAIGAFRSQHGSRFDGLALDIEWTQSVPDPVERNARLVDLSHRLRETVGDGTALGAIVYPAVQTEVVNPSLWPAFPYRELGEVFDVWMPMAYWTQRNGVYRDPDAYVTESVTRLRANLEDPDAVVHPVGGIADDSNEADDRAFLQALTNTGAIGGSLYDFRTTLQGSWDVLRAGIDAATTSPG